MPTSIVKVPGGYQVATPNHPSGHSGKPMTHRNAIAQKMIIDRADGEKSGSNKVKAWHKQKNGRPE